jgi:hypothetical protein
MDVFLSNNGMVLGTVIMLFLLKYIFQKKSKNILRISFYSFCSFRLPKILYLSFDKLIFFEAIKKIKFVPNFDKNFYFKIWSTIRSSPLNLLSSITVGI